MPLVSIILPTYNSICFLPERLETIQNQTFTNWECIVIDGNSEDGSWELIQKHLKQDRRFKAFKFPPKGPYDAWNQGITKSVGDYIYIATSDDTMELNCLSLMVQELESMPAIDIASCNLQLIDQNGNKINGNQGWESFLPTQYLSSVIYKKHIREKSHDFFLYPIFGTVYTSITQIMIRKELFNKTGLFTLDSDSYADYGWGMLASAFTGVVHIPEYLATWRIHSGQLTNAQKRDTVYHQDILIKQTLKNIHEVRKKNLFKIPVPLNDLLFVLKRDRFFIDYFKQRRISLKDKLLFYIKHLIKNPSIVLLFLFAKHRLEESAISFAGRKLQTLKNKISLLE